MPETSSISARRLWVEQRTLEAAIAGARRPGVECTSEASVVAGAQWLRVELLPEAASEDVFEDGELSSDTSSNSWQVFEESRPESTEPEQNVIWRILTKFEI